MKEYSAESGAPLAEIDTANYAPGAVALPVQYLESEYADLPLDCIVAGAYQPRKRFNEAKMAELTASIKADGVHSTILVRPLPADRLQESFQERKKGAKLPTHELVFGERRWRASIAAGNKTTIPARIRVLTDEQVIRMQMVENTQRDDLHPMEEAEGYQHMMTLLKISADQVADEVGVSRGTVYARMKLLDLCEPVRSAFYAEKIDQSRALVIARIPDEKLQLKALEEATRTAWNGDVSSFRTFQHWAQQNVMLRLDRARFKITDASLVADAGSCRECSKRTGAAPDLFADVDSADVCTDPKCFHDKQAVHDAQVLAGAKAKGQTIIDGKAAKRVWEYEHNDHLNGYRRLDRPDPRVDGKKTLKKLLGRDCPEPVMLQSPFNGALIEVVDEAKVTQLLKDRGLLTASQARAGRDISAHEVKAKAEEKYQRTWRKAAIEQAYETISRTPQTEIGVPTIRLLAKMMLQGLVGDDRAHTAQLLGVGKVADAEGIKAYIESCSDVEAGCALLLLFMQHDMHFNQYAGIKDPERIQAVADDFNVDLEAVQEEVKQQTKAAIKRAPGNTNIILYQGPNGETWTGRGLQPRWVTAYVEKGGDLDDLKKPLLPLASAAQAKGVGGEAKGQKTERPLRKPKLSAAEAQAAIAAAMQSQDTDPGAAVAAQGMEQAATARPGVPTDAAGDDSLFQRAVTLIAQQNKASVRLLKTEMGIGTTRAIELMRQLETTGKISACGVRGTRKVLVAA